METTHEILVALLNEGTSVWRPVRAGLIKPNMYRIEGVVPDDEKWEFQPGQVVECEKRIFSEGNSGLIAIREVLPGQNRNLFPKSLAVYSISDREIVLPLEHALTAIDYFLEKKTKILGWEGWVKSPDGRVGHAEGFQGTSDLSSLSPEEAATVCKKTMVSDHARWEKEGLKKGRLYFCLTFDVF